MEYKYRGKRKKNDEWIYGDLWQPVRDNRKVAFILQQDNKYEVHPDSVGMWTGLKDIEDTEIYEKDIIKLTYGIPPISDKLLIEYAQNEYVNEVSVSGWWMRNIRKNGCSSSLCSIYQGDITIIGNTTDNPELLKE